MAVPGVLVGLGATGVVAVATGSTLDPSAAPAPSPVVSTTTASRALETPHRPTPSAVKPSPPQPSPPKPSAAKPSRPAASPSPASRSTAPKREQPTSRSTGERPALKAQTAPEKTEPLARPKAEQPSLEVVDTEYTRVALNVRKAADAGAGLLTVLEAGSQVSVTATVRGDWQFVSYQGDGGWVRHQYLVESKAEAQPKPPAPKTPAPKAAARETAAPKAAAPKAAARETAARETAAPKAAAPKAAAPKAAAPKTEANTSSRSAGSTSTGISSAACSSGSAVESGLTSNAIRVHRAICARFPSVTSFGGVRADSGEHGSGRALDAMVSDSALRAEIAAWVRANAGALGVSEVIYSQRIWTVQRSSEGWRGMADRGSVSANHYDHVHVTV